MKLIKWHVTSEAVASADQIEVTSRKQPTKRTKLPFPVNENEKRKKFF